MFNRVSSCLLFFVRNVQSVTLHDCLVVLSVDSQQAIVIFQKCYNLHTSWLFCRHIILTDSVNFRLKALCWVSMEMTANVTEYGYSKTKFEYYYVFSQSCHVYLNFHLVLNYLRYWGAIGLICSLNFNQPSSPTFFRFFFFLKKISLVLEILNHCPVQFRKLKCATKKEQLY